MEVRQDKYYCYGTLIMISFQNPGVSLRQVLCNQEYKYVPYFG